MTATPSTVSVTLPERSLVPVFAAYVGVVVAGITIGRTARDSVFLDLAGQDALPFAYVAAALATMLVAWVYARLAQRVARRALHVGCAVASAASLGALSGAFYATSSADAFTQWGTLYAYALYVATEASGTLLVMLAWSLVHDAVDVRKGKRVIGKIGAGGQVAAIGGALLSAELVGVGGVGSLVLACASCSVGAAVFAWKYTTNVTNPTSAANATTRTGEHGSAGMVAHLRDAHVVSIALITLLAGVTVHFVDFQFKSAASVAHAGDAVALGVFFGRFHAACNAVGLFVQLALTSRLLQRLGTLGSALPLPISLGGVALASLFAPGLAAASAAKAADSVFRYSLHDASTEILYLPLSARRRAAAKAMISGVLRPLAAVFAGLALPFAVAVGGVAYGNTVVAVAVLALAVAWCAAVLRARRRYLEALGAAIGQRAANDRNAGAGTVRGAADDDPRSLARALAKQGQAAARAALHDERPPMRAAAVLTLMRDGGLPGIVAAADDLRRLIDSDEDDERVLAAVVLGELRVPSLAPSLLDLLATPTERVRRAAIAAIGLQRDAQLGEVLLPLLRDDDLAVEAVRALVTIGDEGQLGRALRGDQLTFGARVRIADALARASAERAVPPLHAALAGRTAGGAFDAGVRRAALFALCKVRERTPALSLGAAALLEALDDEVERAEMLLHVRGLLSARALEPALDREVDACCASALRVLVLMHPTRGLEGVPRALAGAGRANALEILDTTLDGPIKARLLPLLESRRATSVPAVARTNEEWLAVLVTDAAPALARTAAALASSPQQRGPLLRAVASPRASVREAARTALDGVTAAAG